LGTRYYWRVIAINETGESANDVTRMFTTQRSGAAQPTHTPSQPIHTQPIINDPPSTVTPPVVSIDRTVRDRALNRLRELLRTNPTHTQSNNAYVFTGQRIVSNNLRVNHGLGAILYNETRSRNITYFGSWVENRMTGQGITIIGNLDSGHITGCRTGTGVVYVGAHVDGDKSGVGSVYDRNGRQIYHGNFSNDRPTDQNYPSITRSPRTFVFTQSGNNFYIGESENDLRHGTGIFIWANGDIWYGQWRNGERAGRGIFLERGPNDVHIVPGVWSGNTRTGD
jgi:hypothetical protein